jgi:hypothetical protein
VAGAGGQREATRAEVTATTPQHSAQAESPHHCTRARRPTCTAPAQHGHHHENVKAQTISRPTANLPKRNVYYMHRLYQ